MFTRRLSTPLQLKHLVARFVKLNPDIDPQAIDWKGTVGSKEVFAESVEDFKNAYPQYTWEENGSDPYYFQRTQDLRDQADNLGMDVVDKTRMRGLLNAERNGRKTVMIRQNEFKTKKKGNMTDEDCLDRIIADVQDKPIILLSERKHGKSSSLKTIVKRMNDTDMNVIFKVFDLSMSWYHCAPISRRVIVTAENMVRVVRRQPVECVYEIGSLSKAHRRIFVATIMKIDWTARYNAKALHGEEIIKSAPTIIYILEEANTYLDSYSLKKNDEFSQALTDFVSVGRNYGLSGFCVVTRAKGELSPGFRDRSPLLMGRIIGESDFNIIRRLAGKVIAEKAKALPPYHWIYYNGESTKMFRIHDEVTQVPEDLVLTVPKSVATEKRKGIWRRLFTRL